MPLTRMSGRRFQVVLDGSAPWHVETCDVLDGLRMLPDGCVHCAVTSPPYWGLRDYGVDGQLGLEKTPDEFVAAMVGVFREVRRVLRDDGTLWLNIGDSYNAYNGGAGPGSKLSQNQSDNRPHLESGFGLRDKSLKPKDLVGIPWELAKALRAPYYTGRIKSEGDRRWLAAAVDGEGCFYVHRRKAGGHAGDGYYRKADTFSPAICVSNTAIAFVQECQRITGLGSIHSKDDPRRSRTIHTWSIRGRQARQIAKEIYPHLVIKQHECRIHCGCETSGEHAAAAHAALKQLHRGGAVGIDYSAPESCFKQGWYLRSEIIWAKRAPMPESVTDRPTKSHEQVFLLAKSRKYFYDAQASAEPASEASAERYAYSFGGAKSEAISAANVDGIGVRTRPIGDREFTGTRNMRSVWTLSPESFSGAHFATMPTELARKALLAGTSEKGCCAACGTPWKRVTEKDRVATRPGTGSKVNGQDALEVGNRDPQRHTTTVTTTGWEAGCKCGAETMPCLALDPFNGAGTTGVVARRLGLRYIGFELNPDYAEMSRERIREDQPLFNGSGAS